MIIAENLSKTYLVEKKKANLLATLKHFFNREFVKIKAVQNINLSISKGEIVGFLGVNGAGKTTLIKMLCGLIHPTSGDIRVDEYTPKKLNPNFLKKISLVLGQKQQLIWDLPAYDSLRVNAAIYDLSDSEMKKSINQLSKMLELEDELFYPVRKLSLGQRMKLELMASLLHKPDFLFLDEPTLGLDINAQESVRNFLKKYNQETGATILLTSHYMADIKALCKRVILLNKGQIFYDGKLEKIINKFEHEIIVLLKFNSNFFIEDLKKFGIVISIEKKLVKLKVFKNDLSKILNSLFSKYDIQDLQIIDTPIDLLIGEILKKGNI